MPTLTPTAQSTDSVLSAGWGAAENWIGFEHIAGIAVKMPSVDADDVHKAVAWFDSHGDEAVFFGRTILIVAGFYPGENWSIVETYAGCFRSGRGRS